MLRLVRRKSREWAQVDMESYSAENDSRLGDEVELGQRGVTFSAHAQSTNAWYRNVGIDVSHIVFDVTE